MGRNRKKPVETGRKGNKWETYRKKREEPEELGRNKEKLEETGRNGKKWEKAERNRNKRE